MRRALAAGLATLALACAAARAAEAPLPGFHAPQSEPERALDAILHQAAKDENEIDNLLEGRGTPGFRATVDYRRFLTEPLLRAIRAAEAERVKRDCGGHYRDGEICGLDFDPLSCAQDSNDRYLYRTERPGADAARIAYAWPGQPTIAATYQLVRRDGAWKLDGIKCHGDVDAGEGEGFNMK